MNKIDMGLAKKEKRYGHLTLQVGVCMDWPCLAHRNTLALPQNSKTK